jgi:hypothetical protein
MAVTVSLVFSQNMCDEKNGRYKLARSVGMNVAGGST